MTPGPAAVPSDGEIWLAAGPGGGMVLVRSVFDDERVIVCPVVTDVETADEESRIVPAAMSPLGVSIAVYERLRAVVPVEALSRRLAPSGGALDLLNLSGAAGVGPGPPISEPADRRLDVRRRLTDRLLALAPPPVPER